MPELIHRDKTGDTYLYDSPKDAASVAYAQLIGERDYQSAERLAVRMPSVLDDLGTHQEVVSKREAQHQSDLAKILAWCESCGYPIYQRSNYVPDNQPYHRRCYRP